jgi:secreted trypsin-like serine protease
LIPAINSSHCYTTFTILAAVSSNRAFCGGYEDSGKSPCLGDSGGGFYQLDSASSLWNVRGIVSASIYNFDYGCDINKYSIYTNVARFFDWIIETAKQTVQINWKSVKFDCVKEGDW